ncbi:D-alanine--D-alanine ligase [Paenibacillus sp. GCM10012307]|uniref:D-alanine--D-alanine ligase n=1 Tax=Paenibacillus roseus TaxID=2798579 RepID=A0A934J0I4_9BACL|nr:D-alanine--D-alanine ligase [Paenibacillus roseus]MBJ6362597.1 D-alanine--D-alanine ligase [Paenibacillus roseus]
MKIGVVMGGVSSEREVSLHSGKGILDQLDRSKYEIIPVEITSREDLTEKAQGLDLALLALHGSYGEDGTVQGTLETMGIPYTGSGVLSSSICMNKDLSKKLLRYDGISTADWLCWSSMSDYSAEAVEKLGYPVVVKPNSGGSSIGTHIVKERGALRAAVEDAFRWDTEVMIEQFIQGDEITCAIIDGELLPIIRIQASGSEWFDFSAKYEEGGAVEEVVHLPDDVHTRVRAAALGSYRTLKCSVYARVDIILREGIPYVLEVNTLPGMTRTSLLPKSAEAAGMSYSSLLDRIIQLSLAKSSKEHQGVLSHG